MHLAVIHDDYLLCHMNILEAAFPQSTLLRHSRERGNPALDYSPRAVLRGWIPACAGMTVEMRG